MLRAEAISVLHFPPLLPMQTAARLFASSLVLLFLLLSLTPSLFPPAAALRQGVENERYNALPLSRSSLSSCLSPTLPCSPRTEHALLPVLSLKWDTLSSVCCLSLRMNEFKGIPTLDSDLRMMRVCPLFSSAVSPSSFQLQLSLSLSVIDCTSHFCLLAQGGACIWCARGGGGWGWVSHVCVWCSLAWPGLPLLVWLQCVCSLSCQLCCEVCCLPCQPLLLLLLLLLLQLPPLLLGLRVRGEGWGGLLVSPTCPEHGLGAAVKLGLMLGLRQKKHCAYEAWSSALAK